MPEPPWIFSAVPGEAEAGAERVEVGGRRRALAHDRDAHALARAARPRAAARSRRRSGSGWGTGPVPSSDRRVGWSGRSARRSRCGSGCRRRRTPAPRRRAGGAAATDARGPCRDVRAAARRSCRRCPLSPSAASACSPAARRAGPASTVGRASTWCRTASARCRSMIVDARAQVGHVERARVTPYGLNAPCDRVADRRRRAVLAAGARERRVLAVGRRRRVARRLHRALQIPSCRPPGRAGARASARSTPRPALLRPWCEIGP